MAYNEVAEATTALGYLAAWTALDDAAKSRTLDTANLWLVSSYTLPAAPTADELAAMKRAELVAARVGLTAALFPDPGSAALGAITKTRTKVDVIERETQYSTPESRQTGPLAIPEVGAILALAGLDSAVAADAPRAAAFVV